MANMISILILTVIALTLAATTLDYLRREFTTKRRDNRMGQALRRGLSQAAGMQPIASNPRAIQW